MATAIETEICKATKMKQGKQERQPFLISLAKALQDLPSEGWDGLTEEAQDWSNAAAERISKKKEVEDFDTPAEEEDEEEEAAAEPKKKKKTPNKPEPEEEDEEEEEEEEPPVAKKKKTAKAEPEEEEDEPAPKKKKKTAKAEPEEDEDEPPAKKKKAKPAAEEKGKGVKERIKDAIMEDTSINVDDLVKQLGKDGGSVSKVTVSNIRAEFRHTLKYLKGRGNLKGVEI